MKTTSLQNTVQQQKKKNPLCFTSDENIMENLEIFQYEKTWKRTSALSGNQNKAIQ